MRETRNIYLIQCGDDGPFKIGMAVDLMRRIREMQIANHEILHIRAYFEAPIVYEGRLHIIFDDYNIRGEWFRPSPLINELIEAIENGDVAEWVSVRIHAIRKREEDAFDAKRAETAKEMLARLARERAAAESAALPEDESVVHHG